MATDGLQVQIGMSEVPGRIPYFDLWVLVLMGDRWLLTDDLQVVESRERSTHVSSPSTPMAVPQTPGGSRLHAQGSKGVRMSVLVC